MSKPDQSKEIRILYSVFLGKNPNAITTILVGHLLVEHMIEQIIIAKCTDSKKLLKLRFSEKLQSLYPDWLPLHIYLNIKLLNKIRNNLAHNLGIGSYEPVIYGPRREKILFKTPKTNPAKRYFRLLVENVLIQITDYNYSTLGIKENLDTNRLLGKTLRHTSAQDASF